MFKRISMFDDVYMYVTHIAVVKLILRVFAVIFHAFLLNIIRMKTVPCVVTSSIFINANTKIRQDALNCRYIGCDVHGCIIAYESCS